MAPGGAAGNAMYRIIKRLDWQGLYRGYDALSNHPVEAAMGVLDA